MHREILFAIVVLTGINHVFNNEAIMSEVFGHFNHLGARRFYIVRAKMTSLVYDALISSDVYIFWHKINMVLPNVASYFPANVWSDVYMHYNIYSQNSDVPGHFSQFIRLLKNISAKIRLNLPTIQLKMCLP